VVLRMALWAPVAKHGRLGLVLLAYRAARSAASETHTLACRSISHAGTRESDSLKAGYFGGEPARSDVNVKVRKPPYAGRR